MSSIVRVTDIGRPGLLVYMPTNVTDTSLDFTVQAISPTPERSTNSTSYVTVDSGSFNIPSKAWIYSSLDVNYLFQAQFDLKSSSTSAAYYGKAVVDGVEFEASTSSTSYSTYYFATIKKPSSTTISWSFQLKSAGAAYTVYGRNLIIYYCPVWTNRVLYCKNIGANVLLTRATLSPGAGIRIDNEYVYRNTGSSKVTLDFNLLPFYMIEFMGFGSIWVKIEYVRVE